MKHPLQVRQISWLGPLVGLILTAGCSAAEIASDDIQSQAESAPTSAAAPAEPPNDLAAESAPLADSESSAPVPQLAKQADVTLRVDSVAEGIDGVVAIARAQRGDILTLEDNTPESSVTRQRAFMQVRVPQSQLDTTLSELADLGTVQQRTITAEDVSTQLVDLDARLRNLRKTEELLLGIMERSGDVADVLQVAQEVSNVRASIEQIDAQLKALRNRVSYSTVSIRLESAIAASTSPLALRDELGNTWQRATLSFRGVSVGLMKLMLWLLVYSPYIAVVLLVAGGLQWLRRRSAVGSSESS
ncbi:MAG: DUF4349 domain-containing protein [Elainellaceae cyanobacterium]